MAPLLGRANIFCLVRTSDKTGCQTAMADAADVRSGSLGRIHQCRRMTGVADEPANGGRPARGQKQSPRAAVDAVEPAELAYRCTALAARYPSCLALEGETAINASESAVVIRAATPADVPAITRCVCAAYLRHIERVGKQPWPMLQDYSSVIRTSQVHVADHAGRIVGVLELLVTDIGFLLDSVAVDPSVQGTGVGRQLLEFAAAEARRQGFESIYLMTNEKMTENQALYARIGYVLFDRQMVHGYSRVLMRKRLI
jgi:N-acetylglutamate synthase-like GNAT family acetyltransferase